jgi:hypothetical protein
VTRVASRALRLVTIVVALAAGLGLVVGGAAILIVHAIGDGPSTSATRAVKGFLSDIRDEKYSAAYDRLCQGDPNLQPRTVFVRALAQARKRGHGIDSFQVFVAFTKETARLTSAAGTVTFLDGKQQSVTYDVQASNASADARCIVVYGDDLTGV